LSRVVPTLVTPKVFGGAVAWTIGVGAEVAVLDPVEFDPVTATSIVEPTSAPVSE
jgi:hypothetical protein